eukprot:6188371-Pleurochrysis_carterae.AAC.4
MPHAAQRGPATDTSMADSGANAQPRINLPCSSAFNAGTEAASRNWFYANVKPPRTRTIRGQGGQSATIG